MLVGILPRNILLRGIFLLRDFAGGIFLWRDLERGIFQQRDFWLEGFSTPANELNILHIKGPKKRNEILCARNPKFSGFAI